MGDCAVLLRILVRVLLVLLVITSSVAVVASSVVVMAFLCLAQRSESSVRLMPAPLASRAYSTVAFCAAAERYR